MKLPTKRPPLGVGKKIFDVLKMRPSTNLCQISMITIVTHIYVNYKILILHGEWAGRETPKIKTAKQSLIYRKHPKV